MQAEKKFFPLSSLAGSVTRLCEPLEGFMRFEMGERGWQVDAWFWARAYPPAFLAMLSLLLVLKRHVLATG